MSTANISPHGAAPKSASLTILPDAAPLRAGPFVRELEWGTRDPESTAPRALRALARIVEGGLCHRCGSCVGICPTGVLALDTEEYPTVKNLSVCTDCDLCVRVCPGDEFNYEEYHTQVFGAGANIEDTHGTFIDSAVGYANDPDIRENSTSGGIVTALLLDQLERGLIDGAIIIASDETQLWKGKVIVARTRKDVLSGMKSKYAITATNAALAEIREIPGRYALVGLPCQIHGFRKAAALDSRLAERVVLLIGLFCHAAIEHEAYDVLWKKLGPRAESARRFISRVGKHPGTPYLELHDGALWPVYFGDKNGYRPTSIEMINILYRLYTPERCTTCFDALADFADIAVGDPWMSPPDGSVNFYEGWSFVLARTKRGQEAYRALVEGRKASSVSVTRREALACNKLMAGEKHWRAFRVIETHRRQGKPIPVYGSYLDGFPQHRGLQFLKTELHMLSHLFCFLPRYRASVLRFFLGNGGYYLLWLNSRRRAFRFWRRDMRSKMSRALFGRR